MEMEQGGQKLSVAQGDLVEQLPIGEGDEMDGAPRKGGLKIGPFLRTFRRRAWLIASLAGILGTAAWIKASDDPAVYTGSFRILVEPVSAEQRLTDATAVTRGIVQPDRDTLDYPTQFQILTSPKILQPIVDEVQKKYPKFNMGLLFSQLTLSRVDNNGQTKILEVQYKGLDPSLTQDVLTAVANKYLRYSLEERKTSIGEGVKFIEDQLPAVQKRVDELQQRLQVLQQQYQILDPEAQAGALFTQIQAVKDLQQEAQRQLGEQEALYNTLTNQLQLSPEEAIAASALSQDPGYQQLLAKMLELESQIAINSVRFQPDSPDIRALEEQKQSLLPVLSQEAERILGGNLAQFANNPQVLSLQNQVRLKLIDQLVEATNQIQLLTVREQMLSQTKRDLDAQLRQFPSVARRYTELDGQLKIATSSLDQLLAQRETLRIEAAQKRVPWELISEPGIPLDKNGKPVAEAPSPIKKLIGFVAGVVLGCGLSVVWEKYRNVYYTSEDIQDLVPVPLLATIPQCEPLVQSSDAVLSLPEGAVAGDDSEVQDFFDAFESLYANLRFLFAAEPIRSLAVCSAMAGDGKSTIAQYLAQTVASMGQRVLLVDANLRLPGIHNRLNVQNVKGLSDFLTHQVDPNHLIQQSPVINNLFVLPSGQPVPGSQRLLASGQMKTLRLELESNFDLVIYDTPNLMGPMDANFLAAYTDGVLMVVAVRETKQSAVSQAMGQLEKFRLPVLGMVANHLRKQDSPAKPELPASSDPPNGTGDASYWKLPEFSSFSTILKVGSKSSTGDEDETP